MSQTTPPRRYASPQDAAEYLGMSVCTIRRMIDRGEITGYRMPGQSRRVVVDLAEIDQRLTPINAVAS